MWAFHFFFHSTFSASFLCLSVFKLSTLTAITFYELRAKNFTDCPTYPLISPPSIFPFVLQFPHHFLANWLWKRFFIQLWTTTKAGKAITKCNMICIAFLFIVLSTLLSINLSLLPLFFLSPHCRCRRKTNEQFMKQNKMTRFSNW